MKATWRFALAFLIAGVLSGGALSVFHGSEFNLLKAANVSVVDGSRVTGMSSNEGSLRVIGQLGGSLRDVLVSGPYAFLSVGHHLVTLDVRDPSNITIVAETPALQRPLGVLASLDHYVYAADRRGSTFQIVDVSDPTRPADVSTGSVSGIIQSIVVSGTWGYATTGPSSTPFAKPNDLQILDLRDPLNPTIAGTTVFTDSEAFAFAVAGDFAYVLTRPLSVTSPVQVGLVVVDLTDRTRPAVIGVNADLRGGTDLVVAGQYAYVVGTFPSSSSPLGTSWLATVSLADPAHPSVITSTAVAMLQSPNAIRLVGNVALVKYDYYQGGHGFSLPGGLAIFDITDPARPIRRGEVFEDLPLYGTRFVIGGNMAYLVRFDQIFLVDLHDPLSPVQVGTFKAPAPIQDRAIAVDGHYTYVGVDGDPDPYRGHFWIVDVADPSTPRPVADMAPSTGRPVTGIALAGETAYLTGFGGLLLIDISVPVSATVVTQTTAFGIPVGNVVVACDKLYLMQGWGFQIAPTDPADLHALGSYVLEEALRAPTTLTDMAVSGRYAYLACVRIQQGAVVAGDLRVVDVTDPIRRTEVASTTVPTSEFSRVAVSGDRVFLTTDDGFHIVDVSDPRQPRAVGSALAGKRTFDIAVAGSYLYVVASDGLHVLDVRLPDQPLEAAIYQDWLLLGSSLAVVGTTVFAATGDGLVIFRFTPPGDGSPAPSLPYRYSFPLAFVSRCG